MRADAAGKGRRDAAMFEIELGVADLRLGVVDGGLLGALVGRALIDGLLGSERFGCEHLRTVELATGERESRACCLQERVGLRQPDFVGARVNGKEGVPFVDGVAVLEVYSGQRAADLGADLDLLDRGKLTEEAQPGTNLPRQRSAHDDLRKRRGGSRDGGVALTI